MAKLDKIKILRVCSRYSVYAPTQMKKLYKYRPSMGLVQIFIMLVFHAKNLLYSEIKFCNYIALSELVSMKCCPT
jgi:hypothetical protein